MAAKKTVVRLTPGQTARALELSRERSSRLKKALQFAHDVLENAGNHLDTLPVKADRKHLMAMIDNAIEMARKQLGRHGL